MERCACVYESHEFSLMYSREKEGKLDEFFQDSKDNPKKDFKRGRKKRKKKEGKNADAGLCRMMQEGGRMWLPKEGGGSASRVE